MRNILIPLIILFIVFAFLTFNIIITLNTTEKLNAALVSAENFARDGDYEMAKLKIKEFSDEFENAKKYFSIIISHAEIDNIVISANRLIHLCEEKTAGHFFAEISVTKELITHMRDAELPYLENIL